MPKLTQPLPIPLEEGPLPLAKLLNKRAKKLRGWAQTGHLRELRNPRLERARGFIKLEVTFGCGPCIRFEGAERWRGVDVLSNGDAEVLLDWYAYNAVLEGEGNIFRYNSPQDDHNRQHHVHRYDVLSGDVKGDVPPLHGSEARPSLAEAVEEAMQWYLDHRGDMEHVKC